MSASLRNQILSGADFDLFSLLSPFPEQPKFRDVDCGSVIFSLKSSGPANRILSFPEFALAFSRFTEVICSAFPSRRRELNDYASIISGLAVNYWGTHFYTCHRLFSAKCTARVGLWNQCPYWGVTDAELHSRVFLGCRTVSCALCCSSAHDSENCTFIEGNDGRRPNSKSTSSVLNNPNQQAHARSGRVSVRASLLPFQCREVQFKQVQIPPCMLVLRRRARTAWFVQCTALKINI